LDIDAIIVGREANARALAGTTRLWLAGTRAFSPGCVVMCDTGATYVLANSHDAAPPDAHLYGVTWNPEVLRANLAAIPGLADAKVIAVDGMGPAMFTLLRRVAPRARFVAAEVPYRADGVEAACELAQHALDAMAAKLTTGAPTTEVRAEFFRGIASSGVTTPAFEPMVEPMGDGTRAVLRAGVIRDGYEGSLARTYVVASGAVVDPADWDRVERACVAGTSAGALRAMGAIVYRAGYGVLPMRDDDTLHVGDAIGIELADDNAVRHDVVRVTA
jgi:hypothetical protein